MTIVRYPKRISWTGPGICHGPWMLHGQITGKIPGDKIFGNKTHRVRSHNERADGMSKMLTWSGLCWEEERTFCLSHPSTNAGSKASPKRWDPLYGADTSFHLDLLSAFQWRCFCRFPPFSCLLFSPHFLFTYNRIRNLKNLGRVTLNKLRKYSVQDQKIFR